MFLLVLIVLPVCLALLVFVHVCSSWSPCSSLVLSLSFVLLLVLFLSSSFFILLLLLFSSSSSSSSFFLLLRLLLAVIGGGTVAAAVVVAHFVLFTLVGKRETIFAYLFHHIYIESTLCKAGQGQRPLAMP